MVGKNSILVDNKKNKIKKKLLYLFVDQNINLHDENNPFQFFSNHWKI